MCNYDFKSPGQEVCKEGDPGSEVFIVISGALTVETFRGSDSIRLAELGPGAYFGELVRFVQRTLTSYPGAGTSCLKKAKSAVLGRDE